MFRRLLLSALLATSLISCTEVEPEEIDPENPGPGPCGEKKQSLQASEGVQTAGSAELREAEPVLVRLRPSRDGSAVAKLVGGRSRRVTADGALLSMTVTPRERALLERHPDVALISRDRPVRAFGLGEYTTGLRMIGAPDVWDRDGDGLPDEGAPLGQGITICVGDSGLDLTHPELKAVYAGGYDFVDDDTDPSDLSLSDDGTVRIGGGHGTHVAGTIAAQFGSAGRLPHGMDEGGVVGVAPGVRLLVARVLDIHGGGSTMNVIRAVSWCTEQGAKIISLSLGSMEHNPEEEAAMKAAMDQGVLIVAASGNGGTGDPETEPPVAFPAAYPGVIAVGAVDGAGAPTSYTQKGPELTLVAPGTGVLSCGIVGTSHSPSVTVGDDRLIAQPLYEAAVGSRYEGTLVDCGLGDSFTSCGQGATCGGFVAVVTRGGTSFRSKARYLMGQGARAVIFVSNKPPEESGYTFGEHDDAWVPSVLVEQADEARIRGRIGSRALVDMGSADYVMQTGTSMAAPHVAGAAALVWSAKPSLTALDVKQLLIDTAKDVGDEGHDTFSGHGLVQPAAAIERLSLPMP